MSGILTAASAARAAVPPDDLELLPQHADETPGRERERVKRWRTEWHQSGHKIPKDLDDWSDEDRLSPWQWWYHELECYDLISFSRFEEFYNIELRISERLICFDAFSELCCAPREFVPYIVKCFDGRFAMHRCSDQGYYASALLVDCITLVEASAPEEMYDQKKVEFTDPWRELGEPLVHDDQRRIVLALSELTSRGYMVANGDVIRKLSTSTDAWRKYQQWIEFAQCSLGDGRWKFPNLFDLEKFAPVRDFEDPCGGPVHPGGAYTGTSTGIPDTVPIPCSFPVFSPLCRIFCSFLVDPLPLWQIQKELGIGLEFSLSSAAARLATVTRDSLWLMALAELGVGFDVPLPDETNTATGMDLGVEPVAPTSPSSSCVLPAKPQRDNTPAGETPGSRKKRKKRNAWRVRTSQQTEEQKQATREANLRAQHRCRGRK